MVKRGLLNRRSSACGINPNFYVNSIELLILRCLSVRLFLLNLNHHSFKFQQKNEVGISPQRRCLSHFFIVLQQPCVSQNILFWKVAAKNLTGFGFLTVHRLPAEQKPSWTGCSRWERYQCSDHAGHGISYPYRWTCSALRRPGRCGPPRIPEPFRPWAARFTP